MPKIFCEDRQQDKFLIKGEDAHHLIRVCRISIDQQIIIGMADGTEYLCVICAVEQNQVTARIIQNIQNTAEPSISVTLYQALPKADKFELIIQKSVEIGVTEIVPVLTKRCVSRPNDAAIDKKAARWNKISKSAAEQSGRGIIPTIRMPISFAQAVEQLDDYDKNLLFYEKGGVPLSQGMDLSRKRVSIWVGPEGGFEEREIMLATEYGVQLTTLGNRILRCETAPLVALSVLMHVTDNL